MSEWIRVSDELPPENVLVETRVDDAKGCRNTQLLCRKGTLWFMSDMAMYVYYSPTHWRYRDGGEGW